MNEFVDRERHRRRLVRLGGVIALALSLAVLSACSSDPGGAPFRATEQSRYGQWAAEVSDAINAYSRGYVAALRRLDAASTEAGGIDRTAVEEIVAPIRAGTTALAAGLGEHPYPGGAPLPDGFVDDLTQLLTRLDHSADRVLACRSACDAEFEAYLTAAKDVLQIDIALRSFRQLASPLASRAHRLADGLLTAGTLGGQWEESAIEVSPSGEPCASDVRSAETRPVDTAVATMQNLQPRSLAQHSLRRFGSSGEAAQYVNRLRILAAACREFPADPARSIETWAPADAQADRGLPSVGWRRRPGGPSRSFTVSTIVVVVADTVSEVSAVSTDPAIADALAKTLSAQALTALRAEVPAP